MGLFSKIKGSGKPKKKPGSGPKDEDKVSAPSATAATAATGLSSPSSTTAPASKLPATTIIAELPREHFVSSIAQHANSSDAQGPSVVAQPSSSDPAAAPSSYDIDPWALAYEIFQNRQPELIADYKKHLASLQGDATATADFSNPQSVHAIVNRLLEDREEKQWRVSLLGKDVKIREQAEKLTKFLLWSDPIVKSAVTAQPYAALAWSGVSLLLPLLTSGTAQSEAMLKGFNSIADVQVYWKISEKTYLQSSHPQDYGDLVEPLAKLYSHVIEYQARVICHLSSAQLSRAWQNVTDWNNWAGLAGKIDDLSAGCSRCIPPLREKELRENRDSQLREIQESRTILDRIRRALEEGGKQAQRTYEDEKERDLLRDLASNYEGYKNFNPKKVEGTCEWFFNDTRFRKWRDSGTSGLIWLAAGPGLGKSVLSRALIDEGRLSTNVTTSTVCHFFFKDGEKGRMDSTDALCAILHQLFTQDSTGSLIGLALPSHKNHGGKLAQNFSELWRVLVDCASSSDAGEVVCILDALDECSRDSRRQLINQLEEFYFKQDQLPSRSSKLKFLITSRPYDDIEESFGNISKTDAYLRFDGDDKSNEISCDISLVIDARLDKLASSLGPGDREKIAERLKSMENRTYLWLHLTFGIIEQKRSVYSKRSSIERLLSDLPSEVSEAYENILSRSQDEAQTKILLCIILAAAQPLTVDEANVALTLALQEEQLASHAVLESELWPRDNFSSIVKNLCGLFISVYDSRLSFIHQTAREFLIHPKQQGNWQGRFNMPKSHSTILQSCYHYLQLPDIVVPVRDGPMIDQQYPFLSYAAMHWPLHYNSHFREAGIESEEEISEIALSLCDTASDRYKAWSSMRPNTYDLPAFTSPSSLIVASFLGFEVVVKQLLEKGADLDFSDNGRGTPLSLAAENGHEAVVKQLLEKGANMEIRDFSDMTPLLRAVETKNEAVVKQLLEKGAKIESKDGTGMTSLSIAAWFGYKALVELLLERGAKVESRDYSGWTPLSRAASSGEVAVVELLLEKGAEIESRDDHGWTPLSLAVSFKEVAVVELLLEKGADIESRDDHSWTPLSGAARSGEVAVVELLLEKGAEIESEGDTGMTPLFYAILHEKNIEMVELLLEKGAEIESKANDGWTPLWEAVARGQVEVAELLLEKGAEIESRDDHGWTPLSLAASFKEVAVVELLLEKGADIESRDDHGRTPLSWAAVSGEIAVVKLLLEKGAEIESKDNDRQTPLFYAMSHKKDIEMVELLLEKGADLETRNNSGQTPLSVAAEYGHEAVVHYLLERGAELESKDNKGRTPLSLATENGHEAVAEQLHEKGAKKSQDLT